MSLLVVHIEKGSGEAQSVKAYFNDGAEVTVTIPTGLLTPTTETTLHDFNNDFNEDFNI